jgi:hypothetical protein
MNLSQNLAGNPVFRPSGGSWPLNKRVLQPANQRCADEKPQELFQI